MILFQFDTKILIDYVLGPLLLTEAVRMIRFAGWGSSVMTGTGFGLEVWAAGSGVHLTEGLSPGL